MDNFSLPRSLVQKLVTPAFHDQQGKLFMCKVVKENVISICAVGHQKLSLNLFWTLLLKCGTEESFICFSFYWKQLVTKIIMTLFLRAQKARVVKFFRGHAHNFSLTR